MRMNSKIAMAKKVKFTECIRWKPSIFVINWAVLFDEMPKWK